MIVYLLELRKRIFYIIWFFIIIFCINLYFANSLLAFFLYPIKHKFNYDLIATQVTAPIVLPITFSADLALILTIPFILVQSCYFIFPALYINEKKIIRNIIFISVVLFILGSLFGYFIILPWMFLLFSKAITTNIVFMPEINSTINFISRMLIIFGIIFQIPLFCFILEYFKFFNLNALINVRPYVIVIAFIIGMLITPPDVLSQIIVALPLWFLYEIGILFIKLYRREF